MGLRPRLEEAIHRQNPWLRWMFEHVGSLPLCQVGPEANPPLARTWWGVTPSYLLTSQTMMGLGGFFWPSIISFRSLSFLLCGSARLPVLSIFPLLK